MTPPVQSIMESWILLLCWDEIEEQHEHPSAAAVNSAQLEMPQDSHDWKKYGQKYIHNIKKIRSYFKCKNKSCKAKKRVEWHPSSPSHLRIVYDGAHDHRSKYELDQDLSSDSIANQYDLSNQVFRQFDGTS
ncbi:putative WRKY transcription factor 13 [Carex rostrata]